MVTEKKIELSNIYITFQDTQAEVFNRESSATSQSTCMSEDEHDFTLPSIRKKRNVKSTKIDKEEEAYKFMKKATEELSQKDEFTVYGQLIAHKIRNLKSAISSTAHK